MKKLTGILAGLTMTITGTAMADHAPRYASIRSVSYAGTGCPAGTVSERMSRGFDAINLHFDSFVAEAGPGVPLSESRKICTINVDLDYPTGWTYAIVAGTVRGYADLDYGVTGLHQASYYFQGSGTTARFTSQFRGPMNSDFEVDDHVGGSLIWAPCNVQRSLNVSLQLRVSGNRNSYGFMSIPSASSHDVALAWKRCR